MKAFQLYNKLDTLYISYHMSSKTAFLNHVSIKSFVTNRNLSLLGNLECEDNIAYL